MPPSVRPQQNPSGSRTGAFPDSTHSPIFVASLTATCALIVVTARIWFSTDVDAVASSSGVFSAISFAHGMTLFVILGRDRITMPGLFMASSAAIVGISGLLVIPDPSFIVGPHPEASLNTALFCSTLTQIGIGMLCLRSDTTGRPDEVVLPIRCVRWALGAGVVTLTATVLLGDRLGVLSDGFGSSAILLICIAILLSPRGLKNPWNIVTIAGALLVYPTAIISGTGRLRAIALILAAVYIFFLRYGRQWLKVIGVFVAPIILAVLGVWRREYETSLSGEHGNETGLSSMFVGIGNFGSLIRDFDLGGLPTLGASLLSPLRAGLPEGLAPDWMPDAIGYQLAALTDPQLYGTGFSTVATVYGDLWWNFGALGLVIGVPLLAVMLDRIDSWTIRSYRHSAQGPRDLLLLVFFAALLGGVGDIVWSGFHTWIVRMYARIAALAVLWLVTFYVPRRIIPQFVSFQQGEQKRLADSEVSSVQKVRPRRAEAPSQTETWGARREVWNHRSLTTPEDNDESAEQHRAERNPRRHTSASADSFGRRRRRAARYVKFSTVSVPR